LQIGPHSSPNALNESDTTPVQNECLKQEIFHNLKKAQIVICLRQNARERARPRSAPVDRPLALNTFPDRALRLFIASTMQ
jgi:putative transposase